MPKISEYFRDIGVQLPKGKVVTIRVTCDDYFSDVDILKALGEHLGLSKVGGLVSVIDDVGVPVDIDGGLITGVELVDGGDCVDFSWDEVLY